MGVEHPNPPPLPLTGDMSKKTFSSFSNALPKCVCEEPKYYSTKACSDNFNLCCIYNIGFVAF